MDEVSLLLQENKQQLFVNLGGGWWLNVSITTNSLHKIWAHLCDTMVQFLIL